MRLVIDNRIGSSFMSLRFCKFNWNFYVFFTSFFIFPEMVFWLIKFPANEGSELQFTAVFKIQE